MKIIFSYLILFFFLIGCSGYEFVYNNSPVIDNIKNKIFYAVSGDSVTVVKSVLNGKLGISQKDGPYSLSVESVKTVKALVIDKEASATKSETSYEIKYSLVKKESECSPITKKITTKGIYNSKSSGYSFAVDLSKKEMNNKNIASNVDSFINHIIASKELIDCWNEN